MTLGKTTVLFERNYGARWGFFHNCRRNLADLRDRQVVGVAYAELHLGRYWLAVSRTVKRGRTVERLLNN